MLNLSNKRQLNIFTNLYKVAQHQQNISFYSLIYSEKLAYFTSLALIGTGVFLAFYGIIFYPVLKSLLPAFSGFGTLGIGLGAFIRQITADLKSVSIMKLTKDYWDIEKVKKRIELLTNENLKSKTLKD